MINSLNSQEWIQSPERYFIDVVAKPGAITVESLHKIFITVGLNGLHESASRRLVLPKPRDFAAKKPHNREDLHNNAYVEVGMVIKGDMTLWIDGSIVVCPQGSIFVIGPNMPYLPHAKSAGTPTAPHTVVWLALHRGSTMVHQCSLTADKHHLSEYFSFTNSVAMNVAKNISDEITEREPYFETAIVGNLLCLLTGLLRAPVLPVTRLDNPTPQTETNDQDPFSNRVQTFLLSHYHRPLSLPQVARYVGCSPGYLCKRFRASTGQTPFQHLRTIRLEVAKHLLLSEVPIARVAEMVGVEDPLYFSRIFSSHTGESPQNYRARHLKAGIEERT